MDIRRRGRIQHGIPGEKAIQMVRSVTPSGQLDIAVMQWSWTRADDDRAGRMDKARHHVRSRSTRRTPAASFQPTDEKLAGLPRRPGFKAW